ncbi:hypothetical protein Ccrd_025720, partial [Cynara cardunculus var. scolymus]
SSPFARNPNHLLHNPSHNLSTLVNPRKPSSQLPSKQTKIKERSQIVDDFKRAKTSEEMIKAFESMNAFFDHHELGLASCKSDSNSMKKFLLFCNIDFFLGMGCGRGTTTLLLPMLYVIYRFDHINAGTLECFVIDY